MLGLLQPRRKMQNDKHHTHCLRASYVRPECLATVTSFHCVCKENHMDHFISDPKRASTHKWMLETEKTGTKHKHKNKCSQQYPETKARSL